MCIRVLGGVVVSEIFLFGAWFLWGLLVLFVWVWVPWVCLVLVFYDFGVLFCGGL